MTLEINETLTRRIAALARLELSNDEVHLFSPQLASILGYVEKLQEVDVVGIEPLTHPHSFPTPFREDQVHIFPPNRQGQPSVLDSAPDVLESGFKVPPIL